jgi:hypothetical protein
MITDRDIMRLAHDAIAAHCENAVVGGGMQVDACLNKLCEISTVSPALA